MAKPNETKPATQRKTRVPHIKSPLELKIDAAHRASMQPVKVVRKLARILGALPPDRAREVLDELVSAFEG